MQKLMSNTPKRFSAPPKRRRSRLGRSFRRSVCGLLIMLLPLLVATPSSATYQSFYTLISKIPAALKTAMTFEKRQKASPTKDELWAAVRDTSAQYQVSPSLVWAIMSVGSQFDQQVVSPQGAIGLMQLMPSTATEMGIQNPYDPYENILGGVRYLKYLMDRFNGDVRLALAAYRAGPAVVDRQGGIPSGSTSAFVHEVVRLAESRA
ncbi:MAG: lytic transglycosylase domain-containing protein [Bdellovibrionales bacterium]|nr:lytic transglycosylase domain-containing protein [Bdellovibrionales bacterium]